MNAKQILFAPKQGCMLQRTMKNFNVRKNWDQVNAFWILFSKCVNISHINALWKKEKWKIKVYMGCFFYCLKNSKTVIHFENESIPSIILSTIHSINCAFFCQGFEAILLGYKWINSVSVFLNHIPLLDICQDKSVVFIILS